MKNTTKGFHTFSFFQKLRWEEYESLGNGFARYMNESGDMKSYPIKDKKNPERIIGWEYFYKPTKGIRWRLFYIKINPNLTIHGIEAIVTPKVLTENNFIAAATEADIHRVEVLFNKEAEKISPIISKFGQCSVNRADPCLNLDLRELDFPCSPKQMMALIKQGNIPRHFKERKKYDKAAHRMKAADDSFYLESDSGSALQDFKRSLNDLDNILVNPVTIPRKWGVKYIPNLLKAYYDSIYTRLLFANELRYCRHLREYLAG